MTTTAPRTPGPATRVGERRAFQQLDRKLDELARLRETGVLGDHEYHAMLGALGGDTNRAQPTAAPRGGGGRTAMLALGGVAGVAAIVGVAAFAIGGNPISGASAHRAAPDPGAVYGREITGPVNRLTRSARISGRVLGSAGTAEDLAAVRRMATQQLVVVTAARGALADVAATAAQRRSHGILLRATARHRQMLTALARIDRSNPGATLRRFPALVAAARGSVSDYRVALRGAPGVTTAITTAGLADLQGVRQALTRRQEHLDAVAAAEAARQAEAAAEARRLREGGDATLGPVVSGFTAADLGGTIAVDATSLRKA